LSWDLNASREDMVVLSQNFPVALPAVEQRVVGAVLRDLAGDAPSVISAVWPELLVRHQRVGATWMKRYGLDVDPQRVLISTGFQPALWALVSSMCAAGDVILADQLTTPGFLNLCGSLKVRVAGVAGDFDGMSPAAFERAIKERKPKAVYLTPTIHTPTAITMPESRRREIAAVAAANDLCIIEDDDSTPLVNAAGHAPPTFAHIAPDRTFLVSDVSRSLGLGVRLCFVLAPAERVGDISAAMTGTTWMPAPLIAELAARLIDGEGADEIIRERRAELKIRHAMAKRILPDVAITQHDAGHHLWLRLPDEWRSESFAAEAERRGVSLNSAASFAVNRAMSPSAVRLCIGAPAKREDLERALRTLIEQVAEGRRTGGTVM
jgi:DNA-binding transcriptional MocR family regulator